MALAYLASLRDCSPACLPTIFTSSQFCSFPRNKRNLPNVGCANPNPCWNALCQPSTELFAFSCWFQPDVLVIFEERYQRGIRGKVSRLSLKARWTSNRNNAEPANFSFFFWTKWFSTKICYFSFGDNALLNSPNAVKAFSYIDVLLHKTWMHSVFIVICVNWVYLIEQFGEFLNVPSSCFSWLVSRMPRLVLVSKFITRTCSSRPES